MSSLYLTCASEATSVYHNAISIRHSKDNTPAAVSLSKSQDRNSADRHYRHSAPLKVLYPADRYYRNISSLPDNLHINHIEPFDYTFDWLDTSRD
jgi:hypothetical protein